MKLITGSRELTLKLLSSRLNIRPYNKSDKEVADFRKCKGGPTTQHDTKYPYENG